jgi:hypothetical protein
VPQDSATEDASKDEGEADAETGKGEGEKETTKPEDGKKAKGGKGEANATSVKMETVTRTRKKVYRVPLKLGGPGFVGNRMSQERKQVCHALPNPKPKTLCLALCSSLGLLEPGTLPGMHVLGWVQVLLKEMLERCTCCYRRGRPPSTPPTRQPGIKWHLQRRPHSRPTSNFPAALNCHAFLKCASANLIGSL